MKVLLYVGSNDKRARVADRVLKKKRKRKFHVLLTTYPIACSAACDKALMKRHNWSCMVLDEAHMVKVRVNACTRHTW
jgi:SNF2 family DNA or RNA helicase